MFFSEGDFLPIDNLEFLSLLLRFVPLSESSTFSIWIKAAAALAFMFCYSYCYCSAADRKLLATPWPDWLKTLGLRGALAAFYSSISCLVKETIWETSFKNLLLVCLYRALNFLALAIYAWSKDCLSLETVLNFRSRLISVSMLLCSASVGTKLF